MTRPLRVGFEAEIMFPADVYPELAAAAEKKGILCLDDDFETPLFIRRIIASDIEEFVGEKVVAPARPSTRLPSNKWCVKPEYDIEHAAWVGMIAAVEIISPPLPPHKAKEALDAVLEFFISKGGWADGNTGLHINIDVPEPDNFNPLFPAVTLDEEALLQRFGRTGHRMLIPQRHKMIVEAAAALLDGNPAVACTDDVYLEHSLGMGKSFAINFNKVGPFGYIEFRHCGGENYIYEETPIHDAMDIMIEAAESTHAGAVKPLSRIRDSIHAIHAIAERITLVARPDGRDLAASHDVMADGELVAQIFRMSSAGFLFCPLEGGFTPFEGGFTPSPLEVDTLVKARALAAFNLVLVGVAEKIGIAEKMRPLN